MHALSGRVARQIPVRARLQLRSGSACAICAQLAERFKHATSRHEKNDILQERKAHRCYYLNQRCDWERKVQNSRTDPRYHTCTSDGYDKTKSSFPHYGRNRPGSLTGWLYPWIVKIQVTVFQFGFRQMLCTPPFVKTGANYAVTAMAQAIAGYVSQVGTSSASSD